MNMLEMPLWSWFSRTLLPRRWTHQSHGCQHSIRHLSGLTDVWSQPSQLVFVLSFINHTHQLLKTHCAHTRTHTPLLHRNIWGVTPLAQTRQRDPEEDGQAGAVTEEQGPSGGLSLQIMNLVWSICSAPIRRVIIISSHSLQSGSWTVGGAGKHVVKQNGQITCLSSCWSFVHFFTFSYVKKQRLFRKRRTKCWILLGAALGSCRTVLSQNSPFPVAYFFWWYCFVISSQSILL